MPNEALIGRGSSFLNIINNEILFDDWEVEQDNITDAFEINNNGNNCISIENGTCNTTFKGSEIVLDNSTVRRIALDDTGSTLFSILNIDALGSEKTHMGTPSNFDMIIFDDTLDKLSIGADDIELTTTGATALNGDVNFSSGNFFYQSSSGNLGGGIVTPQNKIHLDQNDSTGIGIQFTNTTTGVTSGDGCIIGLNASEQLEISNQEANDIIFNTGGTEKMRIESGGNVGIGKTPTVKLDVDGDISGTNISGTLSTAAQPNITSLGTLTSLDMSGNIDLNTNDIIDIGNVGIGTATPTSLLNIFDNTTNDSVRIGSGGAGELSINSFTTFGTNLSINNDNGNYLNTDTSLQLDLNKTSFIVLTAPSGTSGNSISYTERFKVDTTGVVTTGLDMTGNIDLNTNDIIAVGTITATNLGGTLSTVSQPNITSLGTLTSLDMGGNIDLNTNDIIDIGNIGIGTVTLTSLLNIFDNSTNDSVRIGNGAAGELSINSITSFGTLLSINSDNGDYLNTDTSLQLDLGKEVFRVSTAPSGTSGTAITYTERFKVDTTGVVTTGLDMSGDIDLNTNSILDSGFIEMSADTRQSVARIFNSATGDMFGIEQVSSAQSGLSRPEMRLFTSEIGTSSIGFGKYSDATTFVHQMIILQDGNVGIGVNSPQEKLHLDSSLATMLRFSNEITGNTASDGAEVGLGDNSNVLAIRNIENADIRFYTNNAERAIIRNSGQLRCWSSEAQSNSSLNISKSNSATTNQVFVQFYINQSNPLNLGTADGDIRTDGSGNLVFQDPSDRKLKKNIVKYDNGYNKVKNIRVVEFEWKSRNIGKVIGFIAQEVQPEIPEAVSNINTLETVKEKRKKKSKRIKIKNKPILDKDGNDTGKVKGYEIEEEYEVEIEESVDKIKDSFLGLSTKTLIPYLWSALRKVIEKVEILEAKILILESK